MVWVAVLMIFIAELELLAEVLETQGQETEIERNLARDVWRQAQRIIRTMAPRKTEPQPVYVSVSAELTGLLKSSVAVESAI